MARDFQINGECLVKVLGGEHLTSGFGGTPTELGLCSDSIVVAPRFIHRDLYCDDFGPDVPVEVMTNLAWVDIRMTLIHYDKKILEICMAESLGGALVPTPPSTAPMAMMPAFRPLGANKPLGASGCHYLSLNLTSPQLDYPLRFPASYLTERPVEYPIGTRVSEVALQWRAIPYRQMFSANANKDAELLASGTPLWHYSLDVDPV